MSSRHTLSVYDPELIHRKTALEVQEKMARNPQPALTQSDREHTANSPMMKQLREFAEREAQKDLERQRWQRRDESALDMRGEPKAFDRYIDVHAQGYELMLRRCATDTRRDRILWCVESITRSLGSTAGPQAPR